MIPSDECTVTIGGKTVDGKTVGGKEYHIHRGQSVTIVGTRSIGEMKASWGFNRLSIEIDGAKGEADEAQRVSLILEEHYDALLDWMAKRVVSWDWTDQAGRPLALPDGTPEPLMALSPEELFYLMRILRGEGTADEKNS